jgi:N-acyl homoserine lactone hydrolase
VVSGLSYRRKGETRRPGTLGGRLSGVTEISVHRIDYGFFVRPAEETGTGAPRAEPCLGYLIEHPDGLLLVDTGMGEHPEVDEHYHPRRVPLREALGFDLDDIRYVVNCHLHFDHCGGNPQLPGRPIFTQRAELATARDTEDYTLPELIDPPGITYTELDGEAEVLPGVLIVPTPGHTTGHQSVVVRRQDGTVIVAGQSHDTATAYSADALAHRAGIEEIHVPAWIGRLQSLDPARVVFAHDNAVWTP